MCSIYDSSFLDNNDSVAVLSIIQKKWRNSDDDETKEKIISSDFELFRKTRKEGVCQRVSECLPSELTCIDEVSDSVKLVSVMTQTELAKMDEDFTFSSRQHLEKKLRILEQNHAEELMQQELLHSHNIQGRIQKVMISVENECERKIKKQIQQACKIAVDAVRAEEAIKNRREMETLRLQLEGQQKIKIEEAVSEERIKFQKQLEELHNEKCMWLQERDKELCEIKKQKYKFDIDKMELEAQRSKLACQQEACRQRTREAEFKLKDAEKHEASLKEMNELEMRRAQGEARKTYEVAMEAVTLQRDFYDKEIKSIQRERRLLSVARTEVADKELETSKLVISLRNENESLGVRLQTAESQLCEIGTLLGDKQNLVSTCRTLLKYVKSYRTLKHKLSQSQMEVVTIQNKANDEAQKLKQSLSSAENERLRAQGQTGELISKIEILEKELKLSRRECAELGSLLQECQMVLNSLATSQWSRSHSAGWKSFHYNTCTARLNAPSYDFRGSLQLQCRSPCHTFSSAEKTQDSASSGLINNLGRHALKFHSMAAGQATAALHDISKCASYVPVEDADKKTGPLITTIPANRANDDFVNTIQETCSHNEDDALKRANNHPLKEDSGKLDAEMKPIFPHVTSSKPALSLNHITTGKDTDDTVKSVHIVGAMIELPVETLTAVELQPNRTITSENVEGNAPIASESTHTPKHEQRGSNKTFDVIEELTKDAGMQGAAPLSYSIGPSNDPKSFLTEPYHTVGINEGQSLHALSSEVMKQNYPDSKYNMKFTLEESSQPVDEIDLTISLKSGALAPIEAVRDEQYIGPSQLHNSLISEGYTLNEFEEETKGEATDKKERTDEGSVSYSMNWSKDDLNESTVVSTEVEESQEDGTISLEVISTYYESSVDDNDNNW